MELVSKEIRNKTIAAAATPTEKAGFEAFCAEKGLGPGQMLRLMLSRVCPDVFGGSQVEGEGAAQADRVIKHEPLYLRLDKPMAVEIRQRAAREGTTPQGWIRRLIRSTLHQAPQFSRDEENALLESNRELAHLGRNINQIAHQLNISLSAVDLANAEVLEGLAAEIAAHRAKVSKLINASWGRYGGEGEL
jgi:hypothetical protein